MNRTANYSAFYVKEPFSESNLKANSTHDFLYYNMLRMWKGMDKDFSFIDAHGKTYSVRDSSGWNTLQSRLRERLNASKNIILFLSSITEESRALREELEYGMHTKGLPVIVIYPEYKEKSDISCRGKFSSNITMLWNNVPTFKKYMDSVATYHIPLDKKIINNALNDKRFMVNTMETGTYV